MNISFESLNNVVSFYANAATGIIATGAFIKLFFSSGRSKVDRPQAVKQNEKTEKLIRGGFMTAIILASLLGALLNTFMDESGIGTVCFLASAVITSVDFLRRKATIQRSEIFFLVFIWSGFVIVFSSFLAFKLLSLMNSQFEITTHRTDMLRKSITSK